MSNSKHRRRLRLEPLEPRRMMAGDVSAKVSRGQMIVRGNGLDNAIGIFGGDSIGEFVVRPLDGTTINRQAGEVILSGVTKRIVLRMGDGNDRISLTAASIAVETTIVLGDGNDVLRMGGASNADFAPQEIGPVDFDDRLIVQGGEGNEDVSLAAVRVREDAIFVGGNGNDAVTFTDAPGAGLAPQPVQVDRRLIVALGGGENSLVAQRSDALAPFSLQVGEDLLFSAAAGDDTVTLNHVSLGNCVELSTGAGDDTSNVSDVQAARVSINAGGGDDTVGVSAAQVEKLRVLLGAGDDACSVVGSTVGTETHFDGQGNLDTFDDLGSNLWADLRRKRFETIL